DRLASPSDAELVQRKAVAFLKDLRDRGVKEIDAGPPERLPRSLELIAGMPIAKPEVEMWIEETGLDPLARGLKWKNEPSRAQKEKFLVVVIGGGISGVNAGVHLK